ncbi:MAG TPA: hypothetical protein P5243_07680 [Bacteroidales bacterium]|nr:hypothetical protein [Bacteroidales bacterium]HRS19368.1 hypothetical protein [Bacteroidales bacterium]
MIHIALRIQHFLTLLAQTTVSCIRIIFLSKYPIRIPLLKTTTNCIVLGNGPSLNKAIQEYGNYIKQHDSIAVNMFANTEYFEQIRPRFYVVLAPELWQEDAPPHMKQEQDTLFRNIAKAQWDLYIFAPTFAQKTLFWKHYFANNHHIQIVWFNATPIEGFEFFVHYTYTKLWGMPRPHNILTPALMMAIHQKYENIYILGADHSWLSELYVAETNDVYLTQKHFYDEQTAQAKHMYTVQYEKRKLHEILHKFMCAFASYFVIKTYAEKQNVHIWNATQGSFIDAFDRYKL